jgi:hypothetical protein
MGDTTQMGQLPPAGSPEEKRNAELRSSPRFRVENVLALVYEKGLLTGLGIGVDNVAKEAVNLSTGGLLVRVGDRMKRGTKVGVKLEIEKFNDIIEAEGIVRWCFQAAKDVRNYYAGIQFTKITPVMSAKIARLQSYFMSPEYKSKTARKKMKDPLGIDI